MRFESRSCARPAAERRSVMRPYVLAMLAVVIIAAVAVGVHGCAAEANAVRVIEQNGAAVSKPIPTVTVLIICRSISLEQIQPIQPAVCNWTRSKSKALRAFYISSPSPAKATAFSLLMIWVAFGAKRSM